MEVESMSLAEQLKRLALPQKAGDTHVSLLYTESEAASKDLDEVICVKFKEHRGNTAWREFFILHFQICALGMSGIQQLMQLNPNFESFYSLFGPISREVNRLMQTSEENAKLDKRIAAFLR